MIHAVADEKVFWDENVDFGLFFLCDLKPPVLFCLLSMSVSLCL